MDDVVHLRMCERYRRESEAHKERKVLLLVRCEDGLASFAMDRIEYVEYRGGALTIYMPGGGQVSSEALGKSFSETVEDVFFDARFVRPHESFVVNMNHVAGVGDHVFEMQSGARVPISAANYPAAGECFIRYMVKANGAKVVS